LFVVLAMMPSPKPSPATPKQLSARLISPEELKPRRVPEAKREPIVPQEKKLPQIPSAPKEVTKRKLPLMPKTPPKTMEDKGSGTLADHPESKEAQMEEKTHGMAKERTEEGQPAGKETGKGEKEMFGEELKLAEEKAVEKVTKGSREPSPGKKTDEKEEEEGKPGGETTFSTREYKYYGYNTRLREKIESVWNYPYEAVQKGIYGDLVIRFTILKSGKLGEVRLIRTSGYTMLDDAAMKALRDAAPFWPLPDEWKEDAYTITGHFVYTLGGFYIR
jgi:protein TonB